jgi:hypothetical protein
VRKSIVEEPMSWNFAEIECLVVKKWERVTIFGFYSRARPPAELMASMAIAWDPGQSQGAKERIREWGHLVSWIMITKGFS